MLDLGRGRCYSIMRLNGYNFYMFFSNILVFINCSDDFLF